MLTKASVADGLGNPLELRDVAVADGLVVPLEQTDDTWPRVDLSGLVLAPGFVDIHTHSDLTLLSSPLAHSAVRQGVTTQVVGNCGLGMSPQSAVTSHDDLRGVNSYLDHDPTVDTHWQRLADELQAWRAARTSINVATLAAHIPLHAATAGLADQPADAGQVEAMAGLAHQAIDDGAVGLSTGLVYSPLCFALEDELLALGRVAADRGVVFAWHIRDYIDDLLPSLEQALRVARLTGCRLQISHLQVVGRRNWSAFGAAIAMIDEARVAGLDVAFDMYPYLAGNSMLTQVLPSWVQSGGDVGVRRALVRADSRARVRAELLSEPGMAFGWDEVLIASAPDPSVVGRTVDWIATDRGREPVDAALDLIAEHGTEVLMTAFGRSPEVLRGTLAHPACIVASDGQAIDPDGPTGHQQPHPRSYGCFPHFLAASFLDDLGLSLPEAIRRCTSAPADRVGLVDRGRIAAGLPADLVAFDPLLIADRASYTDPQVFPAGIERVWVSGQETVRGGEHLGTRAGAVLTRPATDRP
ncbi:N-acyl-D-amino-acid deacylase family protein [Aestuariimicrobium kwangyangense]|uniref:N-acyl-D-amino-acid deacylase family protein n=1 Tax=Aestuariimicrobium kwangyangense TaxID=396389 RepID=UPI0003B5A688|nr:amidohydrolase family protein [Aestuariimicrobium kwangyangense]